MMTLKLRNYQKECVKRMNETKSGRHLIVMATGLGKTVTFANIERQGKTLILSHRQELVSQPAKYYDCSFGVEIGSKKSEKSDEVVSASIQSLVRRLNHFDKNEFDTIIIDEAHHACADSYQTILNYFHARRVFGFTATPYRADKEQLPFEDVLFSKDILFGIQNGYLSDIKCFQENIGFDISGISTVGGDFNQKQLAAVFRNDALTNGVVSAYQKHANGRTIVFAVDKEHAKNLETAFLANGISAKAVTDEMPSAERTQTVQDFRENKLSVLINCMIFTEGTDIPEIECVIIARPTKSKALYAQMVGRGLRLSEQKSYCKLIDCTGKTGRHQLCTPADLLDSTKTVPTNGKRLSEISEIITSEIATSKPHQWLKQAEDLQKQFNTHDVAFVQKRNDFFVPVSDNKEYQIKQVTSDGQWTIIFKENGTISSVCSVPDVQTAFDVVAFILHQKHQDTSLLWNVSKMMSWGVLPATRKQLHFIRKAFPSLRITLNQYQASILVQNLCRA